MSKDDNPSSRGDTKGGLARSATLTAQSNQFVTRSELAANEKVGWFTVGDRVYQRIDISKGTQRFVGILEPVNDLEPSDE